MNPRFVPGVLILVAGLSAVGVVWLGAGDHGDPVVHAIVTCLAAGILLLLALSQEWRKFAWAPVGAFVVASAGFAIGIEPLIYTGYIAFAVLSIWHGHQLERRENPTTA